MNPISLICGRFFICLREKGAVDIYRAPYMWATIEEWLEGIHEFDTGANDWPENRKESA